MGGLVYETLIDCSDADDDLRPGLAESWETSADGLRLSLRLRAGVRWHDERPLTVLDVQASLETVLRAHSHTPLLRAQLDGVSGVEVATDRVIRLRLARPSSLIPRALCEIPILPESVLRGPPTKTGQSGRQPIGTGPYRFVSWERGHRIRLARAANSWRKGAFLDELVFDIETDGARALLRLRRGELDVMPHVPEMYFPEQVGPAVLQQAIRTFRITPMRTSFLLPNLRRGPLADVRVRRALSLLWDRQRLAQEAHAGLAQPIGGPVGGASAVVPAFDRAAALRLIAAAGFVDQNGDGVRDDASGAPVRLRLLQPVGARALAIEARAFALELRRVGILLDILVVDPGTVMSRVGSGDFDLAPMLWDGSRGEDPRVLFGRDGEFNHSGYRSDRMTALLDELRVLDTPTKREVVLQRIADLVAEDLPVITLYRHDLVVAVSQRVHGLATRGPDVDLRWAWVTPFGMRFE